jgi:chemoreceptor-like protein with four helix bundle sensory module
MMPASGATRADSARTSRLRPGVRSTVAFAAIAIVVGLCGFAAWRETRSFSSEFDALYEHNLIAAVLLADAQDALWQLRYGFPQFLVLGLEDRKRIVAEQGQWYAVIDEKIKAYKARKLTLEEQDALTEWTDAYGAYVEARPHWFELRETGATAEAAEWRAHMTTPLGAQDARCPRTRQGPGARLFRGAGDSRHAHRRPGSPRADRPQPGRECHQVHRARRRGGSGGRGERERGRHGAPCGRQGHGDRDPAGEA